MVNYKSVYNKLNVNFTCVPAQKGGDGSFLTRSPVVHQLPTKSQRWCDRLEIVGHQDSWKKIKELTSKKCECRMESL